MSAAMRFDHKGGKQGKTRYFACAFDRQRIENQFRYESATPTSPCVPYHAYNLADAAGAEDKARIRLDKARIRMNSVAFDRQRIGNQFRYESAITRGRFHTNYSLMSALMVELAEAYGSDLDDLPDSISATDTHDDLPDQIADSAS